MCPKCLPGSPTQPQPPSVNRGRILLLQRTSCLSIPLLLLTEIQPWCTQVFRTAESFGLHAFNALWEKLWLANISVKVPVLAFYVMYVCRVHYESDIAGSQCPCTQLPHGFYYLWLPTDLSFHPLQASQMLLELNWEAFWNLESPEWSPERFKVNFWFLTNCNYSGHPWRFKGPMKSTDSNHLWILISAEVTGMELL